LETRAVDLDLGSRGKKMKKKKNARFSKCFAIFVSKRYKTVPYKLVVIFILKL
jgi:hypothetical protein